MSYQIITDSCCDFTKQQYADLNLKYVPLTLLYKGTEQEGFTEPGELHAFYNGIRAGEMPTTSAVNPQAWASLMEQSLKDGKDVLCLTFSSGLSTTHQSAVIAAEELRDARDEFEYSADELERNAVPLQGVFEVPRKRVHSVKNGVIARAALA